MKSLDEDAIDAHFHRNALLQFTLSGEPSYYCISCYNTGKLTWWAEECPKSRQINCADISITECLHKFKTTN